MQLLNLSDPSQPFHTILQFPQPETAKHSDSSWSFFFCCFSDKLHVISALSENQSPFALHGMLVRSTHDVSYLPCRAKTGIHPWSEHLTKVPEAIQCEHLPTQLQSGVGPRWGGRSCRWASVRRSLQIFSGYANQLLQQQHLSGWQLRTNIRAKTSVAFIYLLFVKIIQSTFSTALQCFAIIGRSEISSFFNSVSGSRLRNSIVVTKIYLAFSTGHRCITKIHLFSITLQKMSLCRPTIVHGWMT